MLKPGFDFVLKPVAWTARAGAGWIAALDHEILDHPMESDSIVVAVFGEVEKVGDGYWGFRRVERTFDVPFICFNDNADVFHGDAVGRRDRGKCQT